MQNFQGLIRKEMEFSGVHSLLGNFQGVFFVEFLGVELPENFRGFINKEMSFFWNNPIQLMQ